MKHEQKDEKPSNNYKPHLKKNIPHYPSYSTNAHLYTVPMHITVPLKLFSNPFPRLSTSIFILPTPRSSQRLMNEFPPLHI